MSGSRSLRAPILGLALVGAVTVTAAPPAAADPAGPTDYRTEVVAIEPANSAITVEILGGDSFVQLSVESGTEVEVVGYQGEPYLRFGADGSVEQNERSASRWLNDDRFGDAEIPPEADNDAEPEWIVVADGGIYAWHDHRAHWMNPAPPIGAEPGDTILEAVIPLAVDGQAVGVEVRSELLASPSPLAPSLGAIVAATAGVWAVLRWRRRRSGGAAWRPQDGASPTRSAPIELLALVGLTGSVATTIGAAAVTGLPGEAAPSPTWWLLPLVAVVVALATIVVVVRSMLEPVMLALVIPAALALAGVELIVWSWLRREAVVRALIPSQAPEWFDRAVVVGAATTGVVALVAAALLLIGQPMFKGPLREPRP